MGGDTVSLPASTIDDDYNPSPINPTSPFHFRETPNSRDYALLVKNYDDLKDRVESMEAAKSKVLSYTPGSWVRNIGGMTMSDYNIPKTTTLLLIGPKGSGKSSLINRITRVFEEDKFAPERAQVTYNSSIGDGTRFLQEYMVPRNATSFCLYDTRGFSNDFSENLEMVTRWMTKGVRHGELVESGSGSIRIRLRTKCKSGQDKHLTYERRRVDFVIFVVNGLSVLQCMENNGADSQYMHMVTEVFTSPFLSFKDHKPVIAITHGDLLSISERAQVRVYLGHVLGVHPSKQTFDVPDDCEAITELTIVDLVRYALEHADRNLLIKSQPTVRKGSTIQLWTSLLLLLTIGIFISTLYLHGFHTLKPHPESVLEPSPEVKKVMEFDQENVPKPDLEINEVTREIDPEIVHEHIQESIPKPSKKTKKVEAERTPGKKQKMKNVHGDPELDMKIDWKTIRHLWYADDVYK